ncbi:hypothetical protein AAFF_G00040430 [Aldrovandia affinis]|uniref:Glycoprotein hormone subunit beta domain-containing protein n=1 Tax=Aldrovandia affinis TaxID=143900 RepID=A0AAD7WFQ4_9TELE|nr:hypothetical protein AAFF_G00040430 [Aldrovandia affinis]
MDDRNHTCHLDLLCILATREDKSPPAYYAGVFYTQRGIRQRLMRNPPKRPITLMVTMHLVVTALWLALAPALVGACPNCSLDNISISVESEDCGGCVTLNTTACAGMCETEEPVYKGLGTHIQQTCNFREVAYETVHIPGCPDGVDPHFTYPVALSCMCSQCNTDSADCSQLNTEVSGCLTH